MRLNHSLGGRHQRNAQQSPLWLSRMLGCFLLAVAPITWVEEGMAQSISFTNASGGTRSISAEVPQFSVLTSFDFEFLNGDHKLKKISLLPAGERTLISFQDNDGNDPYRIAATFHSEFRFEPTIFETVEGSGRNVETRLLMDRRGFMMRAIFCRE